MGIYRLTTRLLHKAQRVTWTSSPDDQSEDQHRAPKIAIIDGPSLAHHIYYRSLQDNSRAPSASLSYRALSQALVDTLDELEALGFSIRHVYFDGVLPIQKVPTRIARLEKYASQNAAVRTTYDATVKTRRGQVDLDAFLQHAKHDRRLPPPPFLVPSMIEELSTSRYQGVTEVVPGEAEIHCARAATKIGEEQCLPTYVFSDDSDMLTLVQRLDTHVVLLEHLQRQRAAEGRLEISALILCPAQLALEAGVRDFAAIASIMEVQSYCPFETAASKAASLSPSGVAGAEVEEASPVSCTDLGPSQTQLLRFCDPRTAEVLYQVTSIRTAGPVDKFLPFLLDDPLRASAWQCGSNFRQAAIAILLLCTSDSNKIQEYNRKATRLTPQLLQTCPDLDEELRGIASWFDEHLTALGHVARTDKWRLTGMIALLSDLSDQGRLPTRIDDVEEIASSMQAIKSWDRLHLQAQWHATLYSIRFLDTVVAFVLARARDQEDGQDERIPPYVEALLQLERLFSDLPTLSKLFDPSEKNPDQTAVRRVRDHYEALAVASAQSLVSPVPKDDDDRRSSEQLNGEYLQAVSNNPFSLLAE